MNQRDLAAIFCSGRLLSHNTPLEAWGLGILRDVGFDKYINLLVIGTSHKKNESYAAKSRFIDCPRFLPLSTLPFMYICTGCCDCRIQTLVKQAPLHRMVPGDITAMAIPIQDSMLYGEAHWPIMAKVIIHLYTNANTCKDPRNGPPSSGPPPFLPKPLLPALKARTPSWLFPPTREPHSSLLCRPWTPSVENPGDLYDPVLLKRSQAFYQGPDGTMRTRFG